ncbi:hypothetical protein J5N97_025283 [Dioscorea zingiberensis]|uniref:Protein kinase domain-containing protein n=1 Tax=Dioscorea zingiberensis TaxID=325984 RepID=A0A9D5C805_9LILI|nr:hypothetical protein J5N97_025283 [Dioscorea zingiberensis]
MVDPSRFGPVEVGPASWSHSPSPHPSPSFGSVPIAAPPPCLSLLLFPNGEHPHCEPLPALPPRILRSSADRHRRAEFVMASGDDFAYHEWLKKGASRSGSQGGSPDRASAGSGPKRSSVSSGRPRGSSSSARKEFLRKFIDCEILTENLEDWFSGSCEESAFRKPVFDVPFELTALQNFDYALEDVSFQQLIRMPNALYASTSDAVEATAHLAIEDFLHASVKGLWETFWGQDVPMPFSVACIHSTSSKFYPAERAIASGKLEGLCATAVMLKNNRHTYGRWDQILILTLLRPDIGTLSMQSDQQPSPSVLGEALFFALRVLLSRSLSRSTTIVQNSNCVFVLLVDSQYGGVVEVEGDVNKLDFDISNVYECAAEWIKTNAKISVSPIDRIWNKLGNANWGDIGTLQVLLATFYSMVQFCGMPKYSLEDLAAEHNTRLKNRRIERQLVDAAQVNGNGLFPFQRRSISPEIVEVQDGVQVESEETLKLEIGSVLWLEDSNWQKGFQINEVLMDSEVPIYSATPVEEPENLYYCIEACLASSCHRLQHLDRIIHPGQCNKPSSGGNCGHPWCGTPILVTSPVGESLSSMIKNGAFGPEEALKCCHDYLSALATASSAGIRHGDIRPENVIYVNTGVKRTFFVLIGWGHAVLEDRDHHP